MSLILCPAEAPTIDERFVEGLVLHGCRVSAEGSVATVGGLLVAYDDGWFCWSLVLDEEAFTGEAATHWEVAEAVYDILFAGLPAEHRADRVEWLALTIIGEEPYWDGLADEDDDDASD